MSFTVAIVGRPNVGKSTLFNRLAGRKLALVDDTPGVTRDWRAAPARLGGLSFTVVDTAGLEEAFDDSLEARMRRQTERALLKADVALLIVDARAGITPMDHHFADWIRKQPTPVILVANKVEARQAMPGLLEAYELGLGEPVAISAEHGEGMADLVQALLPHVPPQGGQDRVPPQGGQDRVPPQGGQDDRPPPAAPVPAAAGQLADDGQATSVPDGDMIPDDRPKTLQLAIVGRPNVGKSTLLNSLIGEERVLTGPEAGMTRDAIAVEWQWRGRPIRLVDTAGMRRRARVDSKLEKLAVADGLRVIRMAHVVVLVLDADAILDRQDLTIARMVVEEGRALVIAVNKWDAVTDRQGALRQLQDKLETSLTQVRGIPTVTVSALRQQKLDELLDTVFQTYDVWNRRISTSQLNRWLAGLLEHHPPPLVEGRRVKIRYMTQVKSRPPTFALWVNKPVDLPDSYQRYLISGMREAFDMPGVPVRFMLRKGKNPYAED